MLKKIIIFLFFIKIQVINCNSEKKKLLDFSINYFSQCGEDGIIDKIFEIIQPGSKLCLEVGADDGIFLSNTANLWKNKGWKSILIEGNYNKFQELKKNTAGYNCQIINAYIGREDANSLDYFVSNYLGIKEDLDLLSVDIDGNDYYIFESLQMKPKVIICEYNPTIPYYIDIYQEYSKKSWEFGCSISALNRIAEIKGYKLIGLTAVNCIYVDKKYFDLFNNYETNISNMAINVNLKTIITSYNGEPLIVGLQPNFLFPLKNIGYNKKVYSKEPIIKINNISIGNK